MKGDFVVVKVRGEPPTKIQAMTDGASVDYTLAGRNEFHIKVEIINKAGKVTDTALFMASEVLSLLSGHETIKRKRTK